VEPSFRNIDNVFHKFKLVISPASGSLQRFIGHPAVIHG